MYCSLQSNSLLLKRSYFKVKGQDLVNEKFLQVSEIKDINSIKDAS